MKRFLAVSTVLLLVGAGCVVSDPPTVRKPAVPPQPTYQQDPQPPIPVPPPDPYYR